MHTHLTPTLHTILFDLVQLCVETSTHRINNSLGISTGNLDIINLAISQSSIPDDAHDSISHVLHLLQSASKLQNQLVQQIRTLRHLVNEPPDTSPIPPQHAHNAVLKAVARYQHIDLFLNVPSSTDHIQFHPSSLAAIHALQLLAIKQATHALNISWSTPDNTRHLLEKECVINTSHPNNPTPSLSITISPIEDAFFHDHTSHPIYQILSHTLSTHTQGTLHAHPTQNRITLCLTSPQHHHNPEHAALSQPIQVPDTSNLPLKCLIIDDEEAMLAPLKRILKYRNIKLEAYTNPKHALSVIDPSEFGLTMIDYSMNELNGLQTLHELRKKNTNIPAIIITGMPDATLLNSVKNDPLTAVLIKPWTINELLGLIKKLTSLH